MRDKGADGPLFCLGAELIESVKRACEGFRAMRDALMRLLEPPIEALGFELLELEFARAGRGGTLRIYIDRPAADGGTCGRHDLAAGDLGADAQTVVGGDGQSGGDGQGAGRRVARRDVLRPDLPSQDFPDRDPASREVPSQGGISVDDCAAVSHAVSQILDADDPIKGHYTLEVSSPGLDRVLRKRAHFERFVGERVFVELMLPIEGRRRFAGTLKAVLGEAIVVEVDGQAHVLPLERIQKARLRPE